MRKEESMKNARAKVHASARPNSRRLGRAREPRRLCGSPRKAGRPEPGSRDLIIFSRVVPGREGERPISALQVLRMGTPATDAGGWERKEAPAFRDEVLSARLFSTQRLDAFRRRRPYRARHFF